MYGSDNLTDRALPGIRNSALVLAHLALVDTGILRELAGIDEIEVIEERREIVPESHID